MPTDLPTQLSRIEEIARSARTAWFGLLAYLAFVGVTLLGVRDIDFYSLEASTTLPLVNVAIPTTTFFWTAPVLGAALHVYLHLYLLKLWDALADAQARIGGTPLGDCVFPWLVVDWALRRRPDRGIATTHRPMPWLADAVTVALVFLAAPLSIAAAWWRSMPARDELLTLVIAAVLTLSVYAARKSWHRAHRRLKAAGQPPPPPVGWPRAWAARCGFATLGIALAFVSWARTEVGFDWWANWWIDLYETAFGPVFEGEEHQRGYWMSAREVQERWVAERVVTLHDWTWRDAYGDAAWTPLAPIDLVGADLAQRPAEWVSRETAERRFRTTWCRDRDVPLAACDRLHRNRFEDGRAFERALAAQALERARWCASEYRQFEDPACEAYFEDLDREFAQEWTEARDGDLTRLAKPRMRGRDLRDANLRGAFLVAQFYLSV